MLSQSRAAKRTVPKASLYLREWDSRRRSISSSLVQSTFEPLPIDAEVARTFAELVAEARRHGKRPKVMDTWIAATAVAHEIPVYTQDEDFAEIPKVQVRRV